MRALFALTVAWGFLIGDRDMKNADSPAMPTLKIEEYKCSEGLPVGCFQTKQRTVNHNGLTKREMFAMHAMQGLLSSSSDSDGIWTNEGPSFIASEAVAFADALLAELDK